MSQSEDNLSVADKENQTQNQRRQLPQNKDQETRISAASITHVEEYRGPLPQAEELMKYEQIATGTANRILEVFEKRSNHSIDLEAKTHDIQTRLLLRGQWMAFALSCFTILLAGFLIFQGYTLSGISMLTITGAYIIGAFVYKKSDKD